MKRFIKWALVIVLPLAAVGFLAFLYFIPPLTSLPPEEFINGEVAGAPGLEGIRDPAERLLAERGKYLVVTADCAGCHTGPGAQGPDPTLYLAGGMKFESPTHGTIVVRNLTPDRETGLGTRSDDEVKRVLRSGVFHTGRPISHRVMPWTDFSNWTDEDLHAVVVYLRQLRPVRHAIPDPRPGPALPTDVVERAYGGADYGQKK
jgi:hypothetical protein